MSVLASSESASPAGDSIRGILCPSANAELRRSVCEDDDLRAMDQEMFALILLYRRSTAIRQALDASYEGFGESPVASPWPRPQPSVAAEGDSALDALAENLAWLQTQWQRQEGLPFCFEAEGMRDRRRCLLSLYLEHIHRLRVWMPPSMARATDGRSQGPFEVKCEGFTYPLVMTRTDGAVRWLFLEWDGDPRAPEIESPLVLREVSQGGSVNGWGSRYTTRFVPDAEWPVGAATYNLQFETAGTATLINEEAGSEGTSQRCRLRARE
jgi:hypothetical protein